MVLLILITEPHSDHVHFLQAMLGIAALFWNAYIGPSSLAPLS